MSEHIETIEKNGFAAKIFHDDHPEDPRTWNNVSRMWFYHRRYELGDYKDKDRPKDPIRSKTEAERILGEKILLWLPVYMYDHSGLTVSLEPFNCPWDSGMIGYAFVTYNAYDAELRKDVPAEEAARECIRNELEAYDQFLMGAVFGVVVEDTDGDEIEDGSLWGLYGIDYARQIARELLDAAAAHEVTTGMIDES